MDVRVRYLGGRKFEMMARGHQVLSDQPPGNKGTDSAMTPPELFLSALGACAAYYAAEYLNARALPAEDLDIRISGEKGDKPVRIVSLRVEVVVPGLTERHREGVLKAVNLCLLKNTLQAPPQIDVQVSTANPVAEQEPAPVG
jgi:putative redox protein